MVLFLMGINVWGILAKVISRFFRLENNIKWVLTWGFLVGEIFNFNSVCKMIIVIKLRLSDNPGEYLEILSKTH